MYNHSNVTMAHARAFGWCILPTCCHLQGPPIIHAFTTSIQLYICLIWKGFGISHGKIRAKLWMRLGMPVWCCRVHHSFFLSYLSGFLSWNWVELWNKMEIGCVPFSTPAKCPGMKLFKHHGAAARITFAVHWVCIQMLFASWRAQGWAIQHALGLPLVIGVKTGS